MTIETVPMQGDDTDLAREILGEDYISVTDLINAGYAVSLDQMEHLRDTYPDANTLQWIKFNECILVAGPPKEMTVFNIYSGNQGYFYHPLHPDDLRQALAHQDKVACSWLILRKSVTLPRSEKKTWTEQKGLLTDLDYVPNIAELVWVLICWTKVRGTRLLPTTETIYTWMVRTSSKDPLGNRLVVGQHRSGLFIVYYNASSFRFSTLGVAVALK